MADKRSGPRRAAGTRDAGGPGGGESGESSAKRPRNVSKKKQRSKKK